MIGFNLLTAEEATKRLGYRNRSSLTRLVKAGRLKPAFQGPKDNSAQFFSESDIDRIIAERKAAS